MLKYPDDIATTMTHIKGVLNDDLLNPMVLVKLAPQLQKLRAQLINQVNPLTATIQASLVNIQLKPNIIKRLNKQLLHQYQQNLPISNPILSNVNLPHAVKTVTNNRAFMNSIMDLNDIINEDHRHVGELIIVILTLLTGIKTA